MALTDTFLNACRTALEAPVAELTAFRASLAAALAGARSARVAAWHATYSAGADGSSPFQRLCQAVRAVVAAQADASGALGPLDRESAVRTLCAQYAPEYRRPATDAEQKAAIQALTEESQL